jgi:hypothetical protein
VGHREEAHEERLGQRPAQVEARAPETRDPVGGHSQQRMLAQERAGEQIRGVAEQRGEHDAARGSAQAERDGNDEQEAEIRYQVRRQHLRHDALHHQGDHAEGHEDEALLHGFEPRSEATRPSSPASVV